ncbi:MAG TPA: phosphoribosylaminoimidazolecarboxamide formyltransferase [Clostridiaceae bacterium]|nr:phosphoribosylaminoimidazolecarboxamide formyltransferase [Clostridiaceae bacterium]
MKTNEIKLKYGFNPHQKPARVYMENGDLPINVLNGSPGYINLLDALNSWQLVKELKSALGLPAAASFKHVSPAGAAVGIPLGEQLKKAYGVEKDDLSPLAAAYVRARGADRVSSFGDFIALSDEVDAETARIIRREVSDGVIAPSYSKKALEILCKKQEGNYRVIEVDPGYEPGEMEKRQVFGITFEQRRNDIKIVPEMLNNIVTGKKDLPESAKRDLIISMITLKYTQSNSVCFAFDGQVIGNGAGQQSRVHCTRLAGSKADIWFLRQHPKVFEMKFRDDCPRSVRDTAIDLYLRDEMTPQEEAEWRKLFDKVPEKLTAREKEEWLSKLDGVALGSDAFFPFSDNIDRAAKSGVKYVVQPGGSVRDEDVINACNRYGMVMVFTGIRLFHH